MDGAAGGGGRGTLSEIYASAPRLLLRARDGLARLERLESSSSSSSSSSSVAPGVALESPELAFALKRDIAQIQSLCAEMDGLWRSVASKGQRDLWKR